jgi:hypothetical protein
VTFHFSAISKQISVLTALGMAALFGPMSCSSSANPATTSGGGAGSVGGGSNGGNAAGSTYSPPNESGRISVLLNEATTIGTLTTPANIYIYGYVVTGVEPLNYVGTLVLHEGDCSLYSVSVPSCVGVSGGSCGANSVCVGTDTCAATPTKVNVGTVTVTGVGSAPLTLASVSNIYQSIDTSSITYPGFAEGDAVSLSATGAGSYAAFSASTKGIKPLVLSTDTYNIGKTSGLNLAWTAGTVSTARISVNLNLSHHSGTKGFVTCDTSDTGSLSISASMISKLIDLGVAGFPTLTVTRTSEAAVSPALSVGPVVFAVSSSVARTVGIDGYTYCTSTEAMASCPSGEICCPAGKTCDTDTKLCE